MELYWNIKISLKNVKRKIGKLVINEENIYLHTRKWIQQKYSEKCISRRVCQEGQEEMQKQHVFVLIKIRIVIYKLYIYITKKNRMHWKNTKRNYKVLVNLWFLCSYVLLFINDC